MVNIEWDREYVTDRIRFGSAARFWNCMGPTRWNLLLTDHGACTVGNESGELSMQEHDVVLCSPSGSRFFRTAGPWHSFWFHFNPAIQVHWPEPVPGIFRFSAPSSLFRRLLADAREAHHLILTGDGRNNLLIENLLVNLILRGNLYSAASPQSPKMIQCAKYLTAAAELPSMDSVARSFGMSRAKLFADFKRDYGVAPYTYFEQIRFRKVKHLLVNTDLSFSEIAQECGFKSLSYLSRRFRIICGTSLSSYRKTSWGGRPG